MKKNGKIRKFRTTQQVNTTIIFNRSHYFSSTKNVIKKPSESQHYSKNLTRILQKIEKQNIKPTDSSSDI